MYELTSKIEEYQKQNGLKTKGTKTFGEVMTPLFLVNDMLDALPKEVWTNPHLKWLDPCNGIGTFFSVVVERIMNGLHSFEPDKELRYKHIIENMLWACEIQDNTIETYNKIFNPENKFKLNIINGDYLKTKFFDKFDLIVMNPPYQMLKEGNKKSQSLWDKFVIKTISELADGGYLVAVHPDGWRNPIGMFKGVQNLLKSRQMIYLEVHNKRDGIKTFGASTTYDFYCLHNVPPTFNTKIKCLDGTTQRVDISKREFIPNGMFKEINKLIAKKGEERVDLLYSRTLYGNDKKNMSKEQTEEHKYPCVYVTYKDGTKQVWYSNVNKGHFGISKVIFSNGISSPIIDESGEYGVMNFAYGIVDDVENLPYIQKALLNPEFLKLISFADSGVHRYNPKVIALFRKDFWKEFI